MANEVFLPREVIRQKRDRKELIEEELRTFVNALTNGTVSDGQAPAFAMAVFLNGMSPKECAALTLAMLWKSLSALTILVVRQIFLLILKSGTGSASKPVRTESLKMADVDEERIRLLSVGSKEYTLVHETT